MCVPPQIAMAVASAGMMYMEYTNDVSDYNQTTANNANNRRSAVNARDMQIRQTSLRQEQENDKLADEKFNNVLQAAKNSETLKTAAGEDNILGRSIDRALNMSIADGLRNDTKLSIQSDMVNQKAGMDAMEIQARLEGRLGQIVDPNPPSAAEAVIGMATSAYTGHQSVPKGTTWGNMFS